MIMWQPAETNHQCLASSRLRPIALMPWETDRLLLLGEKHLFCSQRGRRLEGRLGLPSRHRTAKQGNAKKHTQSVNILNRCIVGYERQGKKWDADVVLTCDAATWRCSKAGCQWLRVGRRKETRVTRFLAGIYTFQETSGGWGSETEGWPG